MPKPKSNMREIKDISYALCEWFQSQGVTTGQAVAAMGLTIGIIAAEGSEDVAGAMDKLYMVGDSMRCTAIWDASWDELSKWHGQGSWK